MSDLGNGKTRIKKYSVKSYYLYELAAIYETSHYHIRNKIEEHRSEIGYPNSGYEYGADQVELIFQLVKLPSHVRIIRA
jgi:hypothetical protein